MRQKISIRALIKHDGSVLTLRRAIGRDSILGRYELPGGRLEFNEQPRDALTRYIKEHLGAEIETSQLFEVVSFIDPDDPQIQYVFILYLTSLKNGAAIVLSSRYDKYSWNKMQNIQRNLLTNSTIVLLGLTEEQQIIEETRGVLKEGDVLDTSKKMIIYSDGGSRGNPGPSAAAFVIMTESEQIVADGGVYLGVTTNNQAEYQAAYRALKKAIELGISVVDFRMDSNLVVNQLNGIYKIKNRDLWPIYQDILDLLPHFDKITFSHVAREFNQIADSLVNKILDQQPGSGSV